jgi:hypothetical protein
MLLQLSVFPVNKRLARETINNWNSLEAGKTEMIALFMDVNSALSPAIGSENPFPATAQRQESV